MPKPRNVLGACIFISIKMKYSTLKIIGADHSWSKDVFVSEQNILCLRDRHFDNQEGRMIRYQDSSTGESTNRMPEFFYSLYVAFLSYWQLKDYASRKKVQIINCTKDSFIDAFDRGNL